MKLMVLSMFPWKRRGHALKRLQAATGPEMTALYPGILYSFQRRTMIKAFKGEL
jgi:hypothetical protein